PLVSAMRTASRLNSALCVAAISCLLWGEHRSQKTGTKPRQVQIAPNRKQLSFENRPPHCPRAVSHRRVDEPLLSEFSEALCFLQASLLTLLFDRGGAPLAGGPSCINTEFASASQ